MVLKTLRKKTKFLVWSGWSFFYVQKNNLRKKNVKTNFQLFFPLRTEFHVTT